MMTPTPAHPADSHREETVARLLANPDVRPSVILRAKKINAACERIAKQSRPLTTTNVVSAVKRLFPDEEIAASTIWNNTPSGKLYTAVINAWKLSLLSKGSARPLHREATGLDVDIPDSLLNRIEPAEARLLSLLTREALRNCRNQLNAVRSLTSERLIRYSSEIAQVPATVLSREDTAILLALLDNQDLELRGLRWSKEGELVADKAGARSGPGVQDALKAALDFFGRK